MSAGPSFPERADTEFTYRGAQVILEVSPGVVSNENGVEDYHVECRVYGRGTDCQRDRPDKSFQETAPAEDDVEDVATSLVERATNHIDEQADLCESLQTALESACTPFEESGEKNPSGSTD